MSELKPCPFCGKEPTELPENESFIHRVRCETRGCWLFWETMPYEKWQSRPIEDALNKRIAELEEVIEILGDQQREAKNILIDKKLHIDSLYEEGYKLQQRIAELEGIIKSDDERLTEAGLKVNLYFGCDTAEIMAEEILSSRARVAELEEQVWDLNLANEKLESAYFADETIAPDGTLKPSVRKLLERIEKAETDYDIAESHVAALLNRIAELEAAQRWIPVSERLPDNWESVLTIDISKSTRDMVTAFYNPETSRWSTHVSCDLWVTHWMPLPEPPIVYGKVCEE